MYFHSDVASVRSHFVVAKPGMEGLDVKIETWEAERGVQLLPMYQKDQRLQ